MRRLALTLLFFFGAIGGAAAQTPEWDGQLVRPEHFQMAAGAIPVLTVIDASVARHEARAVAGPTGIALTTCDPAGEVTAWRMTAFGDRATLALDALPPGTAAPAPLHLVRARRQEQVATDLSAGTTFVATVDLPSNAEMAAIFAADQADRQPASGDIDWTAVTARDQARRERTRALLDAGALQSGDDFWHAAFVFQHGSEPASYLVAHTLATIAAARGRPDATWIAAATLDRYLQSVGQPQVYGTQYSNRDGNGWTQAPYDRALVSDAMRAALGVPPQAAQAERLRQMEEQRRGQAALPR
jgi:hypothetical protein